MNDVLLSVNNISKRFGAVQALDNVDLTINKGEILCLVGENGSGKSTLIKIISGVVEPDSGEIVIEGKSYKKLSAFESMRDRYTGYLPGPFPFPKFICCGKHLVKSEN